MVDGSGNESTNTSSKVHWQGWSREKPDDIGILPQWHTKGQAFSRYYLEIQAVRGLLFWQLEGLFLFKDTHRRITAEHPVDQEPR